MLRVAAIGDNCVDVYTNIGQAFPGGGAVNFAVYARRAGAETAYVGVIGDDTYGDWMADALTREDVETKHLIRMPGSTALAFVRIVEAERTFFGSDHGVRGQLRVTSEIGDYLSGFDLIHTTLDGGVDEHIPAWCKTGRTISYDFSHRAKPSQIALLPHITVAFFSGQHLDRETARSRLVAYQRQGVRLVVMTLGADGSISYDGQRECHQPALPATVVDTLGGGDAFQAGFMVDYLRTGSVEAALSAGAQQAASACSHFGAFGHGHQTEIPGHA